MEHIQEDTMSEENDPKVQRTNPHHDNAFVRPDNIGIFEALKQAFSHYRLHGTWPKPDSVGHQEMKQDSFAFEHKKESSENSSNKDTTFYIIVCIFLIGAAYMMLRDQ